MRQVCCDSTQDKHLLLSGGQLQGEGSLHVVPAVAAAAAILYSVHHLLRLLL